MHLPCHAGLQCKAWSFRESDGACRLFEDDPGNGKDLQLKTGNDRDAWVSGVGAPWLLSLAGQARVRV